MNEPGVAPDAPLPPVIATRLHEFCSMTKMKRVAMQFIATSLGEEEIAGLREMFLMMDTDRSGTITLGELRKGLESIGANVSDSEVQRILQETDIDHSGVIEYAEFLAATLHLSKVEKQENLKKAFSRFDVDGSGFISGEELQRVCSELNMERKEIDEMLQEVDANKVSHQFIAKDVRCKS